MNFKKIITTLSFILLLGCGYEPIYSKKQINNNYSFSINTVNLTGDNKVNQILKNKLKKNLRKEKISTKFNLNLNSKVIKTVSNDENDKNSRYIRSKIKEFSMKNNIKFIDIAQIIKEKKINKILHGPLDWTHFNYDGYKIVSDYIVKNNVN